MKKRMRRCYLFSRGIWLLARPNIQTDVCISLTVGRNCNCMA